MVTPEEMEARQNAATHAAKPAAPSFRVTDAEMQQYKSKNRVLLGKAILDHVEAFQEKNGNGQKKLSLGKTADIITERCQQSWDSYKKVISGSQSASRPVLYKFCIGLGLNLRQAEALFSLSAEGALNDARPDDHLFLCALRDHDSIEDFIDQYQKYMEKNIALRERSDNKSETQKKGKEFPRKKETRFV